MEEFLTWAHEWLILYGPLSIGWLVAAWLLYERRTGNDRDDIRVDKLMAQSIDVISRNTAAMERLTTLVDERTRYAIRNR